MAKINVDFQDIFKRTMPHFLRKTNFLSFVSVMAYGVQYLNNLLFAFRNEKRTEVSVTAQIVYLEYYLNKILGYDPVNQQIYIENLADVVFTYLRNNIEERTPVYLYNKMEAMPPLYLKNNEELNSSQTYIIHVPSSVTFDEDTMREQVLKYNLAGKSFEIVTF